MDINVYLQVKVNGYSFTISENANHESYVYKLDEQNEMLQMIVNKILERLNA